MSGQDKDEAAWRERLTAEEFWLREKARSALPASTECVEGAPTAALVRLATGHQA